MTKVLIALMTSTAFITGSQALAGGAPPAATDSIESLYTKMLRQLPANVSGAISVTHDGDKTKVTVDIEQMAQSMASMGFKISAKPLTLTYTPLPDGTIRQTTDVPTDIGFDYKMTVPPNQAGSFTYQGLSFDGIIDPKLAFYRDMTVSVVKAFGDISQEANGMTASVTAGENALTLKAESAGEGFINIHQTQKLTGLVERVHMDPSKATVPVAGPAMDMDFKVPEIKADIAINGWNSFATRDLVVFLLDNATPEQKVANQVEFKHLIHGLAPLLKTAEIAGEAHGVTIQSPFGQGVLGTVAVKMGLNAADPLASVSLGERFDDIKVDSVFMPAWSKTLVPTAVDLEFKLTGLDFAGGWTKFINVLDKHDLSDPKFEPDGMTPYAWGEAMGQAVGAPNGVTHFDMMPSSIVSPTYTVKFQGSADVRDKQGKIHMDVSATGVDDVIKTLIQVRDKGAPETVIGLYAAKAVAKPGPDGALLWAIDMDSQAGTFLVNGKQIGPQRKL